jgi:hypothetical protein
MTSCAGSLESAPNEQNTPRTISGLFELSADCASSSHLSLIFLSLLFISYLLLLFLIYYLYIYLLFIPPQSGIVPGRQNTVMRRHCAPAGEAQPPHDGILPAMPLIFGQNGERLHEGMKTRLGFRPPQGHSAVRGCSACLPLIFGKKRKFTGFSSDLRFSERLRVVAWRGTTTQSPRYPLC